MIPPDFSTFWSQAAQQGFKPKIVTIGKALLFPSVIDSLGARGNGLTSEVWWTPHHPFKSGLTGQSAAQLTEAYTSATKRPWTQPIGFQHALFEVAIDVLKRAKSLEPKAILDSIVATDYKSMVGPVKWTGQPVIRRRHQDAAGRRPMATSWRQVRAGHHDQQAAPEISGRRQAGIARLIAVGHDGSANPCPPSWRLKKSPSASAPWWWRTRSTSRSPTARRSASSVRNGAGKTTLFGMATGTVAPDAGRVVFAGTDITRMPPERRCRMGIARSFQIPQPFGAMTVFENLVVAAAFGGGRGERDVYAQCFDTLERCGLAEKANRPAGALPLLDRKRLELARALATGPRVLLLDEVAGGLVEHECAALVALIGTSGRPACRSSGSSTWCTRSLLSSTAWSCCMPARFIAEGEPQRVLREPAVSEIYLGMPTDA